MNKQELMLDTMGKFRTQSLFLELGYSDEAIFTLKDQDYEYEGRKLISLKRLYLEMDDPTEYNFATTHLMGWRHWQRMCENKAIRAYINEWRDELEVKLRCRAVGDAINAARTGNFQAAKWVADRGWATRGAGRPSKADVNHEKSVQAQIDNEYKGDVIRLYGTGAK